MPFPPALPACDAALRGRRADAHRCRGPLRRLPPLRYRRASHADQDSRRGVPSVLSMRRREVMALVGGAVAAWPLPARAQQKAMPVVGFLGSTSPAPNEPVLAALRQGLSETDYVEGQNLAIEYRWAEGHYDRLPALAAELVGRKVDVIFAASTPAAPPA